ncbi:lipid-binding SYLF domain-containing protein [Croceibacterium sp. LX-88]|jgi:lipid-binding SYLF domain-containing protein|uniref:Lipid-binding SYLF domain-containing protein n=1 Tax=Croceibacterium selenioxidans TaxID=2838833 RepID=A0ABS5W009_9SPHN|nr:lipid-binding SYLF domain-containing protein [Croceibacterium selenioxidans]MBT2132796.1 lipid-binding SYLF domain-containing protein [Croceibacterium selenioxidans]
MTTLRNWLVALGLVLATTLIGPSHSAIAASASELSTDGKAALERLYAQSEKARKLGQEARAILVFPKIVKAGFVVGGQSGEGVLFIDGKPAGYYRISAASIGLQAGGQTFGYALFLMNDSAIGYLKENNGWAIGTGPNVVVVDEGAAAAANTTTLKNDVYAFPFDQKGLMAGVDLEGSKISAIHK